MVFAPHQDDETLGCGGTVVLKRRTGATVALVFMTDGTTSHRRFMEEEELRSIRKAEASGAAAILGLSPEDVHFLNFPDGGLKRFHSDAVSRVASLLDRYRPAEVYVPYRSDGTPDHESTHGVIVEAVNNTGRPTEICEYPIWFWNQWPWVPQDVKFDRESVIGMSPGVVEMPRSPAFRRVPDRGVRWGRPRQEDAGARPTPVADDGAGARNGLAHPRGHFRRRVPSVFLPGLRGLPLLEFPRPERRAFPLTTNPTRMMS